MAKQYLLLMQDEDIIAFKKVIPSALFLEVQGMEITGNPMVKILTTPLTTPVVTAPPLVPDANPDVLEEPQAVSE